jgi:DNA end-binding protein Ku
MAKKKPAKKKGRSRHRASWKGQLAFGLVSFPVQAFNALNRQESDIHFHQLHAKCHRRIQYQKVCPIHGEVSNDEIVSGYEHGKGRYIEVEPEELDALRTKEERALTIDTFVEPEVIDPLYLDGRMYYLLPNGSAAEQPYAVMVQAMQHEEKYAVGQVVFSGKDQIVLVRPLDGVLHMAMLNYAAEIRDPADIATLPKPPRGITREVKLAQSLIKTWTNKSFDFAAYEDRYREQVKELLEAKVEGREVVAPEDEEEPAEVINLIDALKRSVAQANGGSGSRRKARKRKRSA